MTLATRRNVPPFRVNLARIRCTEITLDGRIHIDASRIDMLREAVERAGQAAGWPWGFSESFVASRKRHYVHADLTETQVEDEYRLFIRISTDGPPGFSDEPVTEPLLEAIGVGYEGVSFHCTADFVYKKDDGESLVPFDNNTRQNEEHFDVRGMRITRVDEEGRILFSIIVDYPQREDIIHLLTLHSIVDFSKHGVLTLLERFERISRLFFRRRRSRLPKQSGEDSRS